MKKIACRSALGATLALMSLLAGPALAQQASPKPAVPGSPANSATIDELRAEVLEPITPRISSITPDIGELATGFAYGKVWSREGLSKRDRSIATIAALVALNCPAELKLHALRGLANGLTKEEIGEIIIQLTPYVGFPLSVTAAAAVGDVVPRAKVESRNEPKAP